MDLDAVTVFAQPTFAVVVEVVARTVVGSGRSCDQVRCRLLSCQKLASSSNTTTPRHRSAFFRIAGQALGDPELLSLLVGALIPAMARQARVAISSRCSKG